MQIFLFIIKISRNFADKIKGIDSKSKHFLDNIIINNVTNVLTINPLCLYVRKRSFFWMFLFVLFFAPKKKNN